MSLSCDGLRLLTSQQTGYENRTLLLSANRTVTLSALAVTVASVLNRPVHLKIVSVDEYIAAHKGRLGSRVEAAYLPEWATVLHAVARGECSVTDPTLRELVGRELVPFEETVTSMLGVRKVTVQ